MAPWYFECEEPAPAFAAGPSKDGQAFGIAGASRVDDEMPWSKTGR